MRHIPFLLPQFTRGAFCQLSALLLVAGLLGAFAPSALGQIAFTTDRDGNREIYVMNADGTGQRNLTNNPAGNDSLAVWSPDGSKIAFASDRDGNAEVYVMNADGSGQRNLTNNSAFDSEPAWSPDGTKIAFESERDGNRKIYVMNADGSSQSPRTNGPGFDADPAWSPDGTKIAFASDRSGDFEIYVMNADGSELARLTFDGAFDGHPAWSPDGTKLAFESERDGNREIYVMNADGSAPTNLTNNPAFDGEPVWSPDGSKIAFASDRDGNAEVYVMNADGSGQRNLTNNPAFDSEPDWQPLRCEQGKYWDLIPNLKPGAPGVLDDNNLFVNPRWRWQCAGFINTKDKDLDFNRQDPKASSAQSITEDKPTFIAYASLLPSVCSDSLFGGTWGHFNWRDVTVEGTIFWDEFDTSGLPGTTADEDYNIRIVSPLVPGAPSDGADTDKEQNDLPPEFQLRAGVTKYNRTIRKCAESDDPLSCPSPDWRGKLRTIKAEFDSRETVDLDALKKIGWWSEFRSSNDEDKARLIDGHPAIMTGLMGLDAVHGDQSEIHPVHMLAIQKDLERNTADDAWAIFVRNWGDEGFCSHNQHFLEQQTVRLRLPRPPNLPPTVHARYIPEKTQFQFQGFPDNIQGKMMVDSLHRPDVLVTFNLPPWKEYGGIVAAELHLEWVDALTGLPATSSELHSSAAIKISRQQTVTADEEDEEESGEEILSKILAQMTEKQRADYQALMDNLLPFPNLGKAAEGKIIIPDEPLPPEASQDITSASSAPSIRQMLFQDTAIQAACLTAPEVVQSVGDGECSALSNKKADLSVTSTNSPNPVRVGNKLTYTLTVANNGPDEATGVTLIDGLPTEVTFISAPPGCSEADGTVTCNLGNLTKGKSTTVRIVVTPTEKIPKITNRAVVRSNEIDYDLMTNNTSVTDTKIACNDDGSACTSPTPNTNSHVERRR